MGLMDSLSLVSFVYNHNPALLERVCRVLNYTRHLFLREIEWTDDVTPVLFSSSPPPSFYNGAWMQIPALTRADFQIFYMKVAPAVLRSDWLMHVGDDGFILNSSCWSPEFLKWDYIGAPWDNGMVGNDGFSLQSRYFYERCLMLPAMDGSVNGDWWACVVNREHFEKVGVSFAPSDVAAKFSCETLDVDFPTFGFHGKHHDERRYNEGWAKLKEYERTTIQHRFS